MSASIEPKLLRSGQLIRAVYDYEPETGDSKVLSCQTGQLFIIIKATQAEDWLYVISCEGSLGYIPANFVEEHLSMSDTQFLELIDSIIPLLGNQRTNDIITVRQKNHAQVKLTQLRSDLDQKRCRSQKQLITNDSSETSAGHKGNLIQNNDYSSDDSKCAEGKKIHHDSSEKYDVTPDGSFVMSEEKAERTEDPEAPDHIPPDDDNDDDEKKEETVGNEHEARGDSLPEHLIPDLIERIRVCTDLSHDMCKSTLEVVLNTLSQNIPEWSKTCCQMRALLKGSDEDNDNSPHDRFSTDAVRLRDIFKSLWSCKNDEQQRSWPIHEDEELISKQLVELTKILQDANPKVSSEIVSQNNYDNIQMLITYYQMETRRSLRVKLTAVFLEVTRLDNAVIEFMLSTVLPSTLADEMMNHKEDIERWTAASLLFTVIFSTAHKPPITLYDHINEKFISSLLDIVEGVATHTPASDERMDSGIPMESSLPPILSFNLHFDERSENRVLRALKNRSNASQLTENLVSHLNWEEDPTCTPQRVGHSSDGTRINSVHKLLIEIFEERDTAKLFYYNDVRVVIDIIITHLNNLITGDKGRMGYLRIAYNIIRNTAYTEEPHKMDQLLKCLTQIETHESSLLQEKDLASNIKSHLQSSPALN